MENREDATPALRSFTTEKSGREEDGVADREHRVGS